MFDFLQDSQHPLGNCQHQYPVCPWQTDLLWNNNSFELPNLMILKYRQENNHNNFIFYWQHWQDQHFYTSDCLWRATQLLKSYRWAENSTECEFVQIHVKQMSIMKIFWNCSVWVSSGIQVGWKKWDKHSWRIQLMNCNPPQKSYHIVQEKLYISYKLNSLLLFFLRDETLLNKQTIVLTPIHIYKSTLRSPFGCAGRRPTSQ